MSRQAFLYLRSLDAPTQPHPRALHHTLCITMAEHLYPQRWDEGQPTALFFRVSDIQIYRNIVAWKSCAGTNGTDPSDVEVWDWREGRRIWVSCFSLYRMLLLQSAFES